MESLQRRVSCEDSLVVAETKNDLDCLVELEVDQRKRACEEILVTQEINDWWQTIESLGNDFWLRFLLETHHHEGKYMVVEYLLELNDSASLGDVCSHEGRAPSVTDVHSHGFRLSELKVAVDDVRQVWEVQSQALLILFGPFGLVVNIIVALILVVNPSVGQNVTIDVAAIESPDVPVAENRFRLCHRFD